MSEDGSKPTGQAVRGGLTAERVIDGAVALADEIGIEALTIRKLAEAIDVKPMTIYHHVPKKEAIIDGMVDSVFGEIDLPPVDLDWRAAVLVRSRSMRDVLARHPMGATSYGISRESRPGDADPPRGLRRLFGVPDSRSR